MRKPIIRKQQDWLSVIHLIEDMEEKEWAHYNVHKFIEKLNDKFFIKKRDKKAKKERLNLNE